MMVLSKELINKKVIFKNTNNKHTDRYYKSLYGLVCDVIWDESHSAVLCTTVLGSTFFLNNGEHMNADIISKEENPEYFL